MSEKIKITVVIDDEKQNTIGEGQTPKRILLTQDPFVTVLSVLQENRLLESSLCGGRGECGRCAVQFLDGVPMPSALERKRFSPEELRRGYRLACIAKPRTDCVIRLLQNKEPEIPILTKTILVSENADSSGQGKEQTENQTADVMECENKQKDSAENTVKASAAISEGQSHVIKSEESLLKHASAVSNNKSDVMDYMIAVDLGTTTIAIQLMTMKTGEVVDTYCEHNPQRSYGADVLSRIQASCTGHRGELQRLVCESLFRGQRRFLDFLTIREGSLEKAAKRLRCMCIAGNTAMEHLLLGYDVQSLGRSPFTPVKIGVQEMKPETLFACLASDSAKAARSLTDGVVSEAERQVWEGEILRKLPVYLTPGISAFVGGDVVAGLYAMRMLPGFENEDVRQMQGGKVGVAIATDGARLLIDLGTNGEIAITDGRRMLVTATAAGPAFEGSGENVLIGTDRIALTASFLRQGILDETGLLAEPYFSEGVPVEMARSNTAAEAVRNRIAAEQIQSGANAESGHEVCGRMKKEDIRALQMAKAAIRAGIEILWQEMGCPQGTKAYLAGGFGYELDEEAAYAIGLLPASLRGRVQVVGNTSLAGAFLMGRALWEGRIDRSALEEMLTSGIVVESVNLAKRKNFAEHYLQYMNLEKN